MAVFKTELKPQAPIPLHPPLKKCINRTPTWQIRLHPRRTIWQFKTKGKQAPGNPIEVQNLYPYTMEETRVVKMMDKT